jgi:hypothetical protein
MFSVWAVFLGGMCSDESRQGLPVPIFPGLPGTRDRLSGNMDFMTADNSCLVPYNLIPARDLQGPVASPANSGSTLLSSLSPRCPDVSRVIRWSAGPWAELLAVESHIK